MRQADRLMRSVLALFALPAWIAALTIGLLRLDIRIVIPVTGVALAGTLCGAIADTRERELRRAARDLAEATRPRGRTQPALRQVR